MNLFHLSNDTAILNSTSTNGVRKADALTGTVVPRASSSGDGDAFKIHSRIRRRTSHCPMEVSGDGGRRSEGDLLLQYPFVQSDCFVQLERLDAPDVHAGDWQDDKLETLSSIFNPPSCSTSIGETSFGSEVTRNGLEDIDETIQLTDPSAVVDDAAATASEQAQLNIAHGESTIRTHLELAVHRSEARSELATRTQEHADPQRTPKTDREISEKSTPSNMLRNLSLASVASSAKSPSTSLSSQNETPIRKRLRELGLLQKLGSAERRAFSERSTYGHNPSESPNGNTRTRRHSDKGRNIDDGNGQSSMMKRFAAMDIASTPTKRSRNSSVRLQKERTVQVFATPSRPVRTLEDALTPTMSLGHIVQIYSFSRQHPLLLTNFRL
ncbi:hypothetical protein BIW11_14147 [Tropilaelaps mercedesae]|uniref:Uncharacterized protein n=1 Tax=Tropilaelaps mercedesae TaxID=418985 RepID=A0A1V9WZ09_9ACAR|nr:hypothetical protein BIW11_14147 [Tropilaelaps mercedesae]